MRKPLPNRVEMEFKGNTFQIKATASLKGRVGCGQ